MSSSTRRRIPAYALIIAVNGGTLQAPEHDAVKLRNSLATLGIPFTSIDILAGRNATRQNIIQSLRSIADSRQILPDAPIIIYFAGHGTQSMINIPNVGNRKVECIVPYDSSKTVPPIPDITISALLGRIARKKSQYITLLLDCCHAGNGSRSDDVIASETTSESVPEFIVEEVDPDVFEQLDGELWPEALENAPQERDSNSRALSSHPLSFRYPGVTTHILIASCHESEKSLEYVVHGEPRALFTTALIEALGECTEDRVMWTLTHIGLFERVKDIMLGILQKNYKAFGRSQTPQCEGYNKARPVFSTPASPHANHAIAPIVEHSRGVYLLPVGTLAGVPPQAVFEIYDYPGGVRKCVDKSRAAPTGLTESQTVLNVGRDLQLGPDAYAVLCTPPVALPVEMVGEFPALYSDRGLQSDLGNLLGNHEPLSRFIVPVRSGQAHKLRASYSRSQGVVDLQNMYGSALRIRRPSQVPDALAKAVMFFHHLDQPNISPLHNPNMFDVRIRELAEVATKDWSVIDHKDVDTLVPRRDRQPIVMQPAGGCVMPAPHDPNTVFGLQILNRGAYNFFVYVFYFDPSDFSITPIYMPPSSVSYPPLPSRGELAIGYSDSGAAPLSFSIDEHLEKDTGFIKIYYSLTPSDMSSIQQDGFDEQRESRPGNAYHSPASGPFGSIIYPITVTNTRRRH